jgi:hypothetical protein
MCLEQLVGICYDAQNALLLLISALIYRNDAPGVSVHSFLHLEIVSRKA